MSRLCVKVKILSCKIPCPITFSSLMVLLPLLGADVFSRGLYLAQKMSIHKTYRHLIENTFLYKEVLGFKLIFNCHRWLRFWDFCKQSVLELCPPAKEGPMLRSDCFFPCSVEFNSSHPLKSLVVLCFFRHWIFF